MRLENFGSFVLCSLALPLAKARQQSSLGRAAGHAAPSPEDRRQWSPKDRSHATVAPLARRREPRPTVRYPQRDRATGQPRRGQHNRARRPARRRRARPGT